MKIYKVLKWLFLIIIVGIPLLLELSSKYLLKQNIEFTDKLVIFKVIMTWLVTPFVLFIVICFFIVRVGAFVLFEDKKETPLNNGRVIVEYENLASNRTIYYQSINQFLYKRIE